MNNNLDTTDIMIEILLKSAGALEELKKLNAKFDALTTSVGRSTGAVKNFNATMDKTQSTVNKANAALKEVEPATNKASKGLFSMTNILRTAIGTLEAMAIFLVARFIGQAISKSIDSVKQLELAIYKLEIAEKSLSRAGVEVTQKDLLDIADRLAKSFSFISSIDAKKVVSNIAILTKELKLTTKQMEDLARAAAVISLRTGDSLDSVTEQLITGLTKSGRGWADIVAPIDAAVIKEEAINSKLVENEEAWNNLSAAQRQEIETLALLQILNRNVSDELADQSSLAFSATKGTKELSTAWEEFTTAGGAFLKPVLLFALNALTLYVQTWTAGLVLMTTLWIEFVSAIVGGAGVINEAWKGNIQSLDDVKTAYTKASESAKEFLYPKIFPGGVPDVGFGTSATGKVNLGLSKLFGTEKYYKNKDTPTSILPFDPNQIGASAEDIAKAIDKAKDTIQDALDDLKFDRSEAEIDFNLKLSDIDLKLKRDLEDAETDFGEKITDINTKYKNKISDINQDSDQKKKEARDKAHDDELKAERDFQNKLLDLREKFLMDLDDALHARDARQILRLIRQYNADKARLTREREEDRKQKEIELSQNLEAINKDRARRLQDAERDRKQELENAKRDYVNKRKELQLNAQRERDDAKTDYARKLADLQRHYDEKIRALGRSLVQEYNLTVEGIRAVYDALGVYRPGGAIWETWQQYARMIASIGASGRTGFTTTTGTTPSTSVSGNENVASSGRTGSAGSTLGSGGRTIVRKAEGGTILTNRPTNVLMGEAGLEMAKFIPIGRTGRDVNKLFTNLASSGGTPGGNLKLQVVMSEGLVASIVDTSLRNVTSAITTVKRERR